MQTPPGLLFARRVLLDLRRYLAPRPAVCATQGDINRWERPHAPLAKRDFMHPAWENP